MDNEQWFKDKLEQFKDDPEFIKEKILIEFGELSIKAALWDRVKEIAEYDDCILCPRFEQCQRDIVTSNHIAPCYFEMIVDAIEGEKDAE